MRHGWFVIPGEQTGDRTLEDQAKGLELALAQCTGKTVLDIGCAEGLIAHEFARRKAARVHGIELLEDHLEVARRLGKGLPCTWEQGNLSELALRPGKPQRYDIVLALAVIHKVHAMKKALAWAVASCNDLLLIRTGRKYEDGRTMVSKRDGSGLDVARQMEVHGFRLERTEKGAAHLREDVQYWRRQA